MPTSLMQLCTNEANLRTSSAKPVIKHSHASEGLQIKYQDCLPMSSLIRGFVVPGFDREFCLVVWVGAEEYNIHYVIWSMSFTDISVD